MLQQIKSVLKKILPDNIKQLLYKILNFLSDIKYTIEVRKLVSIKNVIKSMSVNFLYNKEEKLYYSPPAFDFFQLESFKLSEVIGHNSYAAVLKEAGVIGGSSLILLDKQNALYDIIQYDYRGNYLYTDAAIKDYKNECCFIKFKDSIASFDEGIFLGGNYSWNYYHLVYEFLVKFKEIDALNLDMSIPLLVDKICFEVPQYFELLSILNKENRKLIPLKKNEKYKVKNLYYFSAINFIPPNFINEKDIQPEDVLFNLESLDYLRKNLLPFATKKDFPKRIYLSRNKAGSRRKFNESEVFDALEKHEFKMFFPEDYSVAEQIALFNNADFIAGGSGAAFTNIIFCNPNCKVIIFAKNNLPFSGFSTIAKYIGVKMLYVTEDFSSVEKMNDIHESFSINISRLNKILSEWYS